MRSVVFFVGLFLAAADVPINEQAECVVDGGEAVNELMDASIYIWASVKRCGKSGEEVKCEVDIASAVESVTQMIKIILKTVQKCGTMNLQNGKCAIAATSLTRSIAGLASASGGIVSKCPNDSQPKDMVGQNWAHANQALCVVDLKDTFKSLFKAIRMIMAVKKSCRDGDSRACHSNELKIVAALAGLGEYLTGAVGHCSHHATLADCGSEISELIHHLTKVSAIGNDISLHCGHKVVTIEEPVKVLVPSQRLYQEEGKVQSAIAGSANIVLAAFLPVTAIVSFVGGRLYAARRTQTDQRREFMSDGE